MGSSGSQNPNWQRYIPRPVTLAAIIAGEGISKDVNFQIPFPDSRLRVKTSIMFRGADPALNPTATLWMYEADIDDSGAQGDDIPLVDIVGTSAAPLSIPANVGLRGYSREFVSAADYVNGRLTVNDEISGYWVLQTRYQPQSVSFSPEEWNLIIAHCNPTAATVRLNG
jgi:hypothetical protein